LNTPIMFADEPVAPPRIVENLSRNQKFSAISDPWTKETIVYDLNPNLTTRNILWKFPRWFDHFEVSADGDELVVQNVDLLPFNFRDDDVLLTFIYRSQVIREIRVREFFGPHPNLHRTTEHFSWGRGLLGIDVKGFVLVDTLAGFFIFEARTANCVFPRKNQPSPENKR
jgi:hypothetical protein